MRIKIALKLRPFSHRPGTRCLIPYSTWEAQVFPAKMIFHDLLTGAKVEHLTSYKGPVKGFTVLLDMERGRVEVFGKGQKGYFRELIEPDFINKVELPVSHKRLALGIHKKQDWDLIQTRCDMAEIFPFWIRLAQIIPEIPLPKEGTALLLQQGKLDLCFQAAFQGILSPRLQDENHLGLIPEGEIDPTLCPIGLLHEGARQIEALLYKDEGEVLHFLPKLPKELHAGRFVNLTTRFGDQVDIEWSKKELKKVVIRAASTRHLRLKLQSQLHSFRLRGGANQRGNVCKSDQFLDLTEGKTLYLDRFKH